VASGNQERDYIGCKGSAFASRQGSLVQRGATEEPSRSPSSCSSAGPLPKPNVHLMIGSWLYNVTNNIAPVNRQELLVRGFPRPSRPRPGASASLPIACDPVIRLAPRGMAGPQQWRPQRRRAPARRGGALLAALALALTAAAPRPVAPASLSAVQVRAVPGAASRLERACLQPGMPAHHKPRCVRPPLVRERPRGPHPVRPRAACAPQPDRRHSLPPPHGPARRAHRSCGSRRR
jgi:hypothetical protein